MDAIEASKEAIQQALFSHIKVDMSTPKVRPMGYATLKLPVIHNVHEAYNCNEIILRIEATKQDRETAEQFERWLVGLKTYLRDVLVYRGMVECLSDPKLELKYWQYRDEQGLWLRVVKLMRNNGISVKPKKAREYYNDGINQLITNMQCGVPQPHDVWERIAVQQQ